MSECPDIVPIGQIPELGVVREKMHAFVIRPERFGEPMKSFAAEEMPVVMTRLFKSEEIPEAHQLMHENQLYGTVSALVGAPRPGLRNLEETRAAIAKG